MASGSATVTVACLPWPKGFQILTRHTTALFWFGWLCGCGVLAKRANRVRARGLVGKLLANFVCLTDNVCRLSNIPVLCTVPVSVLAGIIFGIFDRVTDRRGDRLTDRPATGVPTDPRPAYRPIGYGARDVFADLKNNRRPQLALAFPMNQTSPWPAPHLVPGTFPIPTNRQQRFVAHGNRIVRSKDVSMFYNEAASLL